MYYNEYLAQVGKHISISREAEKIIERHYMVGYTVEECVKMYRIFHTMRGLYS